MGKITAGILGGFTKKVGNIVGARYKGIDYIRIRVIPTMSGSDQSVLARLNMKEVMALARFNNETILKKTFAGAVKGKSLSPINRFVQRALKDIQPRTDYAQIPWSEGVVTKPVITKAEYATLDQDLTIEVGTNVEGYGSADDLLMVFVSNINDPTVDMISDFDDARNRVQLNSYTGGTGMYKILSSKKRIGDSSLDSYVHVIAMNAKGEMSETATMILTHT